MFWPFTVWINCSSDLKIFANSRPSASNFKSFSRSLEQFFLTVGQNNFGNKIPFPSASNFKSFSWSLEQYFLFPIWILIVLNYWIWEISSASDIKNFANSSPSASNFKSFSWSLEQFFLTVGQNNFGNKIPFFS